MSSSAGVCGWALLSGTAEAADRTWESLKALGRVGRRSKPNSSSPVLPLLFADEGEAEPDCLTVRRRLSSDASDGFRSRAYFGRHDGGALGRHVIYVPSLPSTMEVSQALAEADGALAQELVVVAGEQSLGKGRGGNEWVSPAGCLMFSVPLRVAAASGLGRRPAFAQHLLATAAALALEALAPGLPVRIKWPNDLYLRREHKLGGILVRSSFQGGELRFNLGCGLNVDNAKPSVCVNDQLGEGQRRLGTEEVLAEVLRQMGRLVGDWDGGREEAVLANYHRLWLHSGEEVGLEGGERARLLRLDEQGFLLAAPAHLSQPRPDQLFSLHPDHNSLDLFQHLVKAKT